MYAAGDPAIVRLFAPTTHWSPRLTIVVASRKIHEHAEPGPPAESTPHDDRGAQSTSQQRSTFTRAASARLARWPLPLGAVVEQGHAAECVDGRVDAVDRGL